VGYTSVSDQMATLNTLKRALRQKVNESAPSAKQPLSDAQYSAGFDIVGGSSGGGTYQDFIIPQLSQLLAPLLYSRVYISVLEIGPGPRTLLGYLPDALRRKVRKYTAFEPNGLLATRLKESLCSFSETESSLPCLDNPPEIHRIPFTLHGDLTRGTHTRDDDQKFHLILFCHSMYGMKPKTKYVERALEMLDDQKRAMVAIFHRYGSLYLDGLTCQRTASFPTGIVRVADDDEALGCFAAFIAGFVLEDKNLDKAVRSEWRKVCRALGRRDESHPGDLFFSSPNVMMAFTQHATTLAELTLKVPLRHEVRTVKNREARLQCPASIIRPTTIRDVQKCVQWALEHGFSLTVISGGHTGHCLRDNVVAIDMGAFDQVHILTTGEDGADCTLGSGSLVVAEAGCKTGDIISKTMATDTTVPLGSCPSVGAGLWLQGGIGHLARLRGLASDAIVGAVMVSVKSSEVLCIGRVPGQYRPAKAICPKNEHDLLWAIKGAGTNFGIVISVTFEAYPAPSYSVRKKVLPLSDSLHARQRLRYFDNCVAQKLPRNCSADVFLYWDLDQLQLGVTLFEASTSTTALASGTLTTMPINELWGPEDHCKVVNSVGLFEMEMYLSEMHGGHSGGKTSSFKRCLFLKHIGDQKIADRLIAAICTRPTPLCYLHLIHGGGAVGDTAREVTAFGCRDWEFACVITGVWSRNQDDTKVAQETVRWVYKIIEDLLPLSCGAYGADLGPDPRDAALAIKAFGPNLPRLSRLKYSIDPRNVLAYACPLPKIPMKPELIILVTGESGAGKDYCANVWVSVFNEYAHKRLTARAVSISDKTKREYAEATGADLNRILGDRAYKEEHRPKLTIFFEDQVRKRPQLPEEHFLSMVYSAVDVDVLFITGIRDEAPVAAFSHLVPDSRLLQVHIQASKQTRQTRRELSGCDDDGGENSESNRIGYDYYPSLVFDNEATETETARRFAEKYLLPFFHEDLQRLAIMVHRVPDFPRPGVEFRHVLAISQQSGGLKLCSSLLETHFSGDWAKVDAIVSCEAGSFLFASSLALRVGAPLSLIREAGKLPPPTVSVTKPCSNISTLRSNDSKEKRIEMECDMVCKGSSVVVVDDVLSTGRTLCAVLKLLIEAEVSTRNISVLVVAEFPFHRGRELLRNCGFGGIHIRSLLVFGGS